MNNYRILIGPDKQELDLDERVGISLSKVYEDLDNPTKMYATWSKTIQVPMTSRNNRIFDNLFRQDQAVTSSGIDPRKKVPFVLLHNQEHILTGYAKVNDIDNSQKTRKYNITLYSVIADIVNDLKLCTFDATAAPDPKYVLRDPLSEGCMINRNLVKSCWEQTGHNIAVNRKTDLDWIGFMPTYQGKYPDFDSDKMEFTDGNVGPYHDEPYESVEVDEHYLGDYRSYYQQPYVWVDGLFQLLKERIEAITDYSMVLDESWFNEYNPYWTNAIITCPSLYDSQDETGQNPKENYRYQWNQIVSNTSQQSDLSSSHRQVVQFTHSSGTDGIYSNALHSFRAPEGGKAHFKAHYIWTLFAAKTDPQLADGYARLRDDNNLFIEFRAIDAQTLEPIPGAIKRFMFYSNSTDRESGYDTKIDVGIASRNYPNYVTSPDPAVVRKDTGYSWSGELDIDMDVIWNRPYFITFNQYAANNGDPFEFALGSWVPRLDFLWTDFYQITDTVGVSGIRGHYWYLTETSASVEESPSMRSNSKLTMDRVWALDKTPFEFLLDYIKMFRLVFDVDDDGKTVTVMTRDRYFSNYTIEDWTGKLDRTKDYKLAPINFDKRFFDLKYSEAEGQRFKYYQDKYDANYGAYKVDTGYDFNTDSNELFTELTPSMVTTKKQADSMHNTLYRTRPNFMGLTWKYLPKEYFVENDDDGNNAGNSGAFYFRNGRYQCDGYIRHKDNTNTGVVCISDDSDYQIVTKSYCWSQVPQYIASTKWLPDISPYSGNFTFQFKEPKELYFNREALNPPSWMDYIYDMFWKKYMDDRYSVQTKVLTCYMYLTANDFLNFRFNKFVMVDNILYMVNEIKDFNLTTDRTTKVQLVQVGDISAYTASSPSFPYLYTSVNDFIVSRDTIRSVEVFSSSEWSIAQTAPNVWANKNGNMLEVRAYNLTYVSKQTATIYLTNLEGSMYPVRMTFAVSDPALVSDRNSVSFARNGGTEMVSIYNEPAGVTVVSKPSWCTCEFMLCFNPVNNSSPFSAMQWNVLMYISASANQGTNSRSGNITVTNGHLTLTVQVSQSGNNTVTPGFPDVPVMPGLQTQGIERLSLSAGEASPVTLNTSKEVKLNSVQISNGVTSTFGSSKVGTVVFNAQPEMSEQHAIEGKTSDGGVITMQTADGELVKWNYNIGDVTTRWTVAVHSLDGFGHVTVGLEDGNYMESVEDGTQLSISATPETGYLFVEWNDGNQNPSRTITVDQDLNLYPIFVEDVPLATYTVTNSLTCALNGNSTASVTEHTPYSASITAFRWYTLRSVTVTMDGVNITSSAYRNGQIYIPDVTGDIVVTATADWGEWDYVWSSQENAGPLDFTVYNSGGSLENCTEDVGQMLGDAWVHRDGVMTLPTADMLEWDMECGFIQAVSPGTYPLFDLANVSGFGGAVQYDQVNKTFETDIFSQGSMAPVGQSMKYGKKGQLLHVSNDNAKVVFKYGSGASFEGDAIGTVSSANTITCRVNGVGVDMYVYTIRAKFRGQGVQTYSVDITSDGNGDVYVGGVQGDYSATLLANTQLNVSAVPSVGFAFDTWSDGNANATRTLYVTEDTFIEARFARTVPADNEFWYWTSDSTQLVLDPNLLLDSGGNPLTVTDHSYDNNKGVVTLSGDLAELVGNAFDNMANLSEVHFPQSLTVIGDECFRQCTDLSSVKGIDNVYYIGHNAFQDCTGLKSFTVPQSVSQFGMFNDSSEAFQGCSGLVNVDIQAEATVLPPKVFEMCTSMETVSFPDTIETINEGAFNKCSKLSEVTLPSGLLSIKNNGTGDQPGAFQECTNLQRVEFNQALTAISNDWAFRETALTSIKLPDSLTKLGNGIFFKCGQLDTAVLGSGLTEIGDQCFGTCSIIKEIYSHAPTAPTLGTDVFANCPTDGVLHIPNGADYSAWESELPARWTIVDNL